MKNNKAFTLEKSLVDSRWSMVDGFLTESPTTNYRLPSTNQGFTLIELSVVIVIIGLIVAGVVAGQSLIQQAQIRSMLAMVNAYRIAYNTFKLQYGGLPGDLNTATTYFSNSNIVDGNANGLVGKYNLSESENLQAFRHLSVSGLINGEFTGVWGAGAQIGVNIPKNPYGKNNSFYFYGDNLWTKYKRGNSFSTAIESGSGFNGWNISVKDAYNIDIKTDDGLPYIGKTISYADVNGGCATAKLADITTADLRSQTYRLSTSTTGCTMNFAFDDYVFR